ncbi:MAG: helix-turn-helix domain-containing protein [Thermodesulfobacteriota bacterium]
MESPGEYLRRERGLRGISLDEVKGATRIQKKYLEALEADDYAVLPHATFVKGFIRSYCKCLGVDENDAVLRYEIFVRESSAARPREKASAEPVAAPASEEEVVARNTRNIILFVVAGVVIIVVLYFAYSRQGGPGPVVVEREAAEAPRAGAPAAEAEPEPPITTAYKAPRAVAAPGAAAPTGKLKKPAAVSSRRPAKPTPAAPAAAGALAVKEARHTLEVKAREKVWVQVSIDSEEPFDVTLREGESITWRAAEGFALVVGNAGGVTVTFDGREMARLGGPGEVKRLSLPVR